MAVVELAPVAPIESASADPTLVEAPATDDAPLAAKTSKAKATKAPKEKKAVIKKPSLHPTYLEMIHEAIVSLKERTGSSQYAISKFVEDKHKDHLPANFKKLLLVQLRKLTAAGKLTKVKNSYKIPAKPVVGGKKTTVYTKLKPKSAAVKPKKAAVKPKPKASAAKPKTKPKASAAKPKTKSAAVKPKTAVKSKSVATKPKTSSGLAKAAKTSVKATPAKLKKAAPVAAKKPKTVKKAPAVKKAEK